MDIIVTDVDSRLGYTVARILSKSGYKILGVSASSIQKYSPIFKAIYNIPDVSIDTDGWITNLISLFPHGTVIFPTSMQAYEAVLSNRGLLEEKFIIPDTSLNSFMIAKNKLKLKEICDQIGVLTPPLIEGIESSTSFPVILKRSCETGFKPEERYEILASAEDLKTSKLYLRQDTFFQKYVFGTAVGVGVYCRGGEIKSIFMHTRLREEILTGGPSTYCERYESLELANICHGLMKAMRWTGIAMIEFKKEHGTGKYYLLEINPRPWGSIQLPYESGVNFLVNYIGDLTHLEPPKIDRKINLKNRLKLVRLDCRAVKNELQSIALPLKFRFVWTYLKEYLDPQCKYEFSWYDYYRIITKR